MKTQRFLYPAIAAEFPILNQPATRRKGETIQSALNELARQAKWGDFFQRNPPKHVHFDNKVQYKDISPPRSPHSDAIELPVEPKSLPHADPIPEDILNGCRHTFAFVMTITDEDKTFPVPTKVNAKKLRKEYLQTSEQIEEALDKLQPYKETRLFKTTLWEGQSAITILQAEIEKCEKLLPKNKKPAIDWHSIKIDK